MGFQIFSRSCLVAVVGGRKSTIEIIAWEGGVAPLAANRRVPVNTGCYSAGMMDCGKAGSQSINRG
ncbi:MAG: hypothetical protein KatS3mg087_1504 [Patescibacteria group bacterium]|nr:MAG: hypothetical protein KatS3mg087_1504 [Patescibacteria group bacterium]